MKHHSVGGTEDEVWWTI